MKAWTAFGIAVASLALLLVSAACGDDNDNDMSEPVATYEASSGDVREIAILASDDFRFDPSEITLTAGEPVRIVLDNSDAALLHDLNIEGMEATGISTEGGADHMMDDMGMDGHMGGDDGAEDLHVSSAAGDTAMLALTPTEAGEYVFYCSVEGHRDSGMEGTITVE